MAVLPSIAVTCQSSTRCQPELIHLSSVASTAGLSNRAVKPPALAVGREGAFLAGGTLSDPELWPGLTELFPLAGRGDLVYVPDLCHHLSFALLPVLFSLFEYAEAVLSGAGNGIFLSDRAYPAESGLSRGDVSVSFCLRLEAGTKDFVQDIAGCGAGGAGFSGVDPYHAPCATLCSGGAAGVWSLCQCVRATGVL